MNECEICGERKVTISGVDLRKTHVECEKVKALKRIANALEALANCVDIKNEELRVRQ